MKKLRKLLIVVSALATGLWQNAAWAAADDDVQEFKKCVEVHYLSPPPPSDPTNVGFNFNNKCQQAFNEISINWKWSGGPAQRKVHFTFCNSRKQCSHLSILASSIKVAPAEYVNNANKQTQANNDNGPSREETTQFIVEHLEHAGTRYKEVWASSTPDMMIKESQDIFEYYAQYDNIDLQNCTLKWSADKGERQIIYLDGHLSATGIPEWEKQKADMGWSFSGAGLAKISAVKGTSYESGKTPQITPQLFYVSLDGKSIPKVSAHTRGFFFDDAETANQMVAAFRRMSQLCGGKAAPFEE